MPGRTQVSVVMPIHNGERYLRDAIESVLAQSLAEFELIAIDDGSTDATPEILASFAERDSRVTVETLPGSGQSAALNHGLSTAESPYVAIMHADDLSLPDRLARQVAFMDAHPAIGICGSWVQLIGEREGELWAFPAEHDEIRCHLLFANVLPHPSVIMRCPQINELGLAYDDGLHCAQDYDLWVRAAERVRVANLPEALVHYRVHAGQTTRTEPSCDAAIASIHKAQIERLGLKPGDRELALHQALAEERFARDRAGVEEAIEWLGRLETANEAASVYPRKPLAALSASKLYAACRSATAEGLWAWNTLRRSRNFRGISRERRGRLLARCLAQEARRRVGGVPARSD
jgi:hypothetical protein